MSIEIKDKIKPYVRQFKKKDMYLVSYLEFLSMRPLSTSYRYSIIKRKLLSWNLMLLWPLNCSLILESISLSLWFRYTYCLLSTMFVCIGYKNGRKRDLPCILFRRDMIQLRKWRDWASTSFYWLSSLYLCRRKQNLIAILRTRNCKNLLIMLNWQKCCKVRDVLPSKVTNFTYLLMSKP